MLYKFTQFTCQLYLNKAEGSKEKMQKEDLKANKTLSLLCLCDFNGLHVKSTVLGNGVKEQNKDRLSERGIKSFQEHNTLNCGNNDSND